MPIIFDLITSITVTFNVTFRVAIIVISFYIVSVSTRIVIHTEYFALIGKTFG